MPARHRILYLETSPSVGGGVISLYELLKGLDRTAYDPVVVTYTAYEYVDRFRAVGADVVVLDVYGQPEYRPGWVKPVRESGAGRWLQQTSWGRSLYHGFGSAMLFARCIWPRAMSLRRIIDEMQVELVHTNAHVTHEREGIIAARLAGRPCVCHVRAFERLGWLDRRLADLATRFIYISKAVQQSHLESGVPCQRGRVVYNGLDVPAFVGALNAAEGRASLALTADDLAVGIVGRLDDWKGQEVFLRAMRRIKDAVPQAKGVVVGDPAPNKLAYRDALLALRNELGLVDTVAFKPFQMDVPVVMSALDVLVLASTSPEPFGRVLIEAMAAGKPVVATDAGASREIIDDGVQGLLVPPRDAEALARSVVYLLTHRDAAAAMGRKGQARVDERFGSQQYVEGVQAVYRELLEGTARGKA